MDVLHDRCAGLDISKRDVKACLRTPGTRRNQRRSEVRTFATTTNDLLALRDWLVAEQVSLVVMEGTGDYWRAPYYLLEDALNVELVNARQVKAMPGRKTDVADAVWLAQLAECGLLRASFVPPEPIRQLRDLTRYRTVLTEERTREAQRLEKELEDAGIKLSSFATDILGISGRAMLEALIRGERDAQVLAEMARGRMRSKIPDLAQAMIGRFGDHHAFLCRMHLDRIDAISRDIATLSTRIERVMAPFRDQLTRLDGIPGISLRVAEVIIAETGGDMSRFPTAGHLASWAGVSPGNHESGGKRKSGKTTKGNRWLRDALGTAAMAAARSKNTYLGAQYTRLVRRLGSKPKALVALEHSILTSVWHMLTDGTGYQDLGADHFLRRDPERERRRAIAALNKLGYTVTLNPIEPTTKAA
ncbi:IS110 family transposase [Micromonospora inyonensis]|uniref:Transposase n=1 Tax=Micromonospora inyonensis TaxID=47866 RepID=A0A1C6S615_9ACTN|nr:IS110 family transposase [Micromonospora inyonensis]SCL24929.1 Transposase [Micromonospora inyonensis]SCL24932.1 Transposase [Micromonospora inyonensis]